MTPNDGHCHLDRGGLYTESLNQVLLYLLLSKSDEYCQHFSAVDLLVYKTFCNVYILACS